MQHDVARRERKKRERRERGTLGRPVGSWRRRGYGAFHGHVPRLRAALPFDSFLPCVTHSRPTRRCILRLGEILTVLQRVFFAISHTRAEISTFSRWYSFNCFAVSINFVVSITTAKHFNFDKYHRVLRVSVLIQTASVKHFTVCIKIKYNKKFQSLYKTMILV